MVPTLILDMSHLLVTFCAVGVGFALVGLGALLTLAIEDGRRRKRAVRAVLAGVAISNSSARPADRARAAA